MFVRKKKNPSGVVSIQIIDKSSGKYKVLKTIGSSSAAEEINTLVKSGQAWIRDQMRLGELDFTDYAKQTQQVLDNIQQITVSGTVFLLGKLFDEIGFNKIEDVLFRKLVIARVCFPASKLKTTDFLSKYHSLDVDVQSVYRYLDKLHSQQKELVQQISYNHTLSILNHHIHIVFYDVTTIYFESESEDELKKTGFSKDGKHQHPQLVLGLLVSKGGYPLAYDIFQGNKFEGHTMLPIIDAFKNDYNLGSLIVVADSGLMSKTNVMELQQKGYEYIIGARIKVGSKGFKEQILALKLKNGESAIINKDDGSKLIVHYSESRARKDGHNRRRGFEKLEKQIRSNKLSKAHINNRGYNKYLVMEGEMTVKIDREKFETDAQWDGLKGYETNCDLPASEIMDNYKHLWQIEKAFRISKTDLKIRPIYHRLQRRIEAHICISFAAYKIYKELERQLKEKESNLSAEQAIEIAKTIYTIKIHNPNTNGYITQKLLLTPEQVILANLFNF